MTAFVGKHFGGSCVVMDVTPELARQMLATSSGNRPMRQWFVNLLASAQKRGEWRITNQGIGFDVHGHLRDGHHRLTAIVQSGVTIRTVVVFDMPESAFEVIDTGMTRSCADRMGEDKRVVDVLRFGCEIACSTARPTIDQMRPYVECGFGDVTRSLIGYCGAACKTYSSAPFKLGAVISVMDGCDSEFVFQQYRAMVALDFDAMSSSAVALVRQFAKHEATIKSRYDILARAFRVFDPARRNLSKIQVGADDRLAAVDRVRIVLRRARCMKTGIMESVLEAC